MQEQPKVRFKISTIGWDHNRHPRLVTNITGDEKFCAYAHCTGECGYPALFFRRFPDMSNPLEQEAAEASGLVRDEQGRVYQDYKAHGSMVAAGPVWQRKRWTGRRVYLPEPYYSDETLLQAWWF